MNSTPTNKQFSSLYVFVDIIRRFLFTKEDLDPQANFCCPKLSKGRKDKGKHAQRP